MTKLYRYLLAFSLMLACSASEARLVVYNPLKYLFSVNSLEWGLSLNKLDIECNSFIQLNGPRGTYRDSAVAYKIKHIGAVGDFTYTGYIGFSLPFIRLARKSIVHVVLGVNTNTDYDMKAQSIYPDFNSGLPSNIEKAFYKRSRLTMVNIPTGLSLRFGGEANPYLNSKFGGGFGAGLMTYVSSEYLTPAEATVTNLGSAPYVHGELTVGNHYKLRVKVMYTFGKINFMKDSVQSNLSSSTALIPVDVSFRNHLSINILIAQNFKGCHKIGQRFLLPIYSCDKLWYEDFETKRPYYSK